MKGDFSRQTFANARDQQYSTVLMQQGRVQLDADWNEQQAIHQYRHRAAVHDMVGPVGGPHHSAGFAITVHGDNTLGIGKGRYYVDGILCEVPQDVAYHVQPHLPNAPEPTSVLSDPNEPLGLVYLDVWERHVTALDDPTIREIALGGPDTTTRAQTVWQTRILRITSRTPEVNAIKEHLRQQMHQNLRLLSVALMERLAQRIQTLETNVRERIQHLEHRRDQNHAAIEVLNGLTEHLHREADNVYARRVEAAERDGSHATVAAIQRLREQIEHLAEQLHHHLETLLHANAHQESIQEIRAVRSMLEQFSHELRFPPQQHGGDTSESTQVERELRSLAQRLKIDEADVQQAGQGIEQVTDIRQEISQIARTMARHGAAILKGQLPEWQALAAAGTGALAVRLQPPDGLSGRQIDNQLYRVEVHEDSAASGGPSYKWSRDNGSIVTQVERVDGPHVMVHDVGPDDIRGFAPGQHAELISDYTELNGLPGQLLRVVDVDPATRIVTLERPLESVTSEDARAQHMQLRRWDGAGPIGAGDDSGWLSLENGLEVQFSAGTYHTGDYWQIPMRAATSEMPGGIEWPINGTLARPAQTIDHHLAPQALIAFDGIMLQHLADGRHLFHAATEPAPSFHIESVRLSTGQLLHNDGEISTSELAQGLTIVCDANVVPVTIHQATCFVTLDLPFGSNVLGPAVRSTYDAASGIVGFIPLTLANAQQLEVEEHTIRWKPDEVTAHWLEATLFQDFAQSERILAHLTLKGRFIWSQADPTVYLDGRAMGVAESNGQHIGLHFPTGNASPGSDFEMWFWLLPARLKNVTIPVNKVAGRSTVTASVALTKPAPRGGATVTLSSDMPQAARVPESVIVDEGRNSASFQVEISPVTSIRPASIRASYAGRDVASTLTVEPLLKVERVRILNTGSSPANPSAREVLHLNNDRLEKQPVPVSIREGPNAVEVRFSSNANVDVSTIVADTTFVVEAMQSQGPQVIRGEIVQVAPNTVRWVPREDSSALTTPNGVYRVTLVGNGDPAITSQEGRRLDGAPSRLPSGNDIEGGDFSFELRAEPGEHRLFGLG